MIERTSFAIASALLFFFFTNVGYSETTAAPAAARSIDDVQKELDQAVSRNQQLEQIIRLTNQNIAEAQFRLLKEFYEAKVKHDIETMRQINAVYDWQITASNVSLGLVIIIVLSGVGFSGFQLWHAAMTGQPQAENQLEVSAQSFRLTSSVVGIVVLSLAFLFFYLFVKEIYAIKPPNTPAAVEATK